MAGIKSKTDKMVKTPSKLGLNLGTAGLAIFVVGVTVASSFALARFDNVVTRKINAISSGQTGA